jgi:hypothetical protein
MTMFWPRCGAPGNEWWAAPTLQYSNSKLYISSLSRVPNGKVPIPNKIRTDNERKKGGQVRTSTKVEYTLTASSTENGSTAAACGNLTLHGGIPYICFACYAKYTLLRKYYSLRAFGGREKRSIPHPEIASSTS